MSTEPTITPTLRSLDGVTADTSYELDRVVTVLGKLADCDIVLDHNTVSKRHAKIVCRPDGYYIEDLNSLNKTYLDGRLVERPERLNDGGVIEICVFRLVFSQPSVTVDDEGSSTILGVLDTVTDDPRRSARRAEEKLRALMEINHDLAGTLDLKAVLAKVLSTLFRIFPHADRGFVLLRDETSTELVPSAIKCRHGDAGHLTISRTVFNRVIANGQAVLSEDAAAEFDEAKSVAEAHILTLMAAPLRDRQRRPFGVLQLDTRDGRGKFGGDDLDLLAAVADQIGLAVENARLHAVEVRQRELDQEARSARAVQLALLPSRRPALDGYEFWDGYEPARSVGGDYYDYVPLDPAPAARWAVAVGDVEGKGMPAALLMARLAASARVLLQTERDPARAIALLNRGMIESGLAERFISFVLVIVDGASHRLTVVNAGHMAPLVRRAGGRVESIGAGRSGFLLGVDPSETYPATEADLAPGDVVVLYTDGITEAADRHDRLFGVDGLTAVVADAPAGASAVGDAILRAVRDHVDGSEPADDVTLLCFGRRAGPAPPYSPRQTMEWRTGDDRPKHAAR